VSSSCFFGEVVCSGQCVDTKSNAKHCGACGTACAAGETCKNSLCRNTCASGQSVCDGKCVDLKTSAAHCGSCGTACVTGETCKNSLCRNSCASGQSVCGGKCVDLKTSAVHCGACGTACQGTEACEDGQCKSSCAGGKLACEGQCVDVQTSKEHCGACGNVCGGGKLCSGGKCGCASGLKDCDGRCVNIKDNYKHCGACGKACNISVSATDLAKVDGVNVSSVTADASGNMYLMGFISSSGGVNFGDVNLRKADHNHFIAKLSPTKKWLWAVGLTIPIGRPRIVVSKSGEVYIASFFRNKASFGSIELVGSDTSDPFVAKLDKSGKWLWALKADCSGNSSASRIVIDSAGNAYVTGAFREKMTMGKTTLTSLGLDDIFVAKVDTSGKWGWAISAGSTFVDNGYSLALDTTGALIVAGRISKDATFGERKVEGSGGWDIFVAKVDKAGKWLWIVDEDVSGYLKDVVVDSNNHIYVTGAFQGKATFDGIELTSEGKEDIFVAKLDNKQKWAWAIKGGNSFSDSGEHIAVDPTGSVYVSGIFQGATYFGATRLFPLGKSGIFIAKMDSMGSWDWAMSVDGESAYLGRGIGLDGSGHVYIGGYFKGDVTIDGQKLSSTIGDSLYTAKLKQETQPCSAGVCQ